MTFIKVAVTRPISKKFNFVVNEIISMNGSIYLFNYRKGLDISYSILMLEMLSA